MSQTTTRLPARINDVPEVWDTPPGMVEHAARAAFRDLMRVLGFEEARQRMAEIINDEADGRRKRS